MMNFGTQEYDDGAVAEYIAQLEASEKKATPVIDAARDLYASAKLDDKTGLYCVDYHTMEKIARLVRDYDRAGTQ